MKWWKNKMQKLPIYYALRVAGCSPIRHSPMAKVQGVYWRKYGGLSPIGEIPGNVLAKVQCTFANWRNSRGCVGENTVDFHQLAKVRWTFSVVTKQY